MPIPVLSKKLPNLAIVDWCLIDTQEQGGVTPVASVLPSATAVKIKVNGQLEIFFIVNSQATISL